MNTLGGTAPSTRTRRTGGGGGGGGATGGGAGGAGRTFGASQVGSGFTQPPVEIVELLNIADNSSQLECAVPVGLPIFQPFPSLIEIAEYKPFQAQTLSLVLRNNDVVTRRVKVVPPDSPFFAVSAPQASNRSTGPTDGKIAAGMEVAYTITFKPADRREYFYDLLVVTEREKFIVPIRVAGTRAVLELPERVTFPSSAVKNVTMKSFVARNTGNKPVRVLLSTSAPFGVSPASAHIDVGGSVQVQVTFKPDAATAYAGELQLQQDDGSVRIVPLSGTADNLHVHLSANMVQLESAYITLTSQSRITVHNSSDIPVKFQWKSTADHEADEQERSQLLLQLDRMEAMEMEAVQANGEPSPGGSLADDLSDDEGMPLNHRAEFAAVTRKYANLRRQVHEDPLMFADPAFQIEPAEGEIWAHSDMDITITFCPHTAAQYRSTAYLEVTGRDARLPLLCQGTGIGPKAQFSYDVLDIGDVFIGSVHRYQLELQNRGDIAATYSVAIPDSPFGPKFQFEPSSGTLAVGDTHTLTVTFCSDILGEFSECFRVAMQGSNEELTVHFKGHVVGPTFHLDVDELNFGVVAFEFLNSKTFNLFNTSEIPMKYRIRVPQDGRFLRKEFRIIPAEGTVLPEGRQKIQVDFISVTLQNYDMYLTIDVEGVGDSLLSIPITAQCVVPPVALADPEIKFGECFIRYPYQRKLTLVNTGDQPARYEVLEQDEHSLTVAAYEPDVPRGTVDPGATRDITITLMCEKLGKVNLPVYVRISGSEAPVLLATIQAVSVGPRVVPAKEVVDWGNTLCLTDVTQTLELHNNSLIPAPFKTFVKASRSKFSVDIKEGVLAPDERLTLTLTANLDDTLPHKDQLHVLVTEGGSLVVPLRAKGIGTTLHCEKDLNNIDFGPQFTNNVCEFVFVLENKGRRAQTITWINATCKAADAELKRKIQAAQRAESKEGGPKRKDKELKFEPAVPVFTVEPETVDLKPFTACTFRLCGKRSDVGLATEQLECLTKLAKDKKVKPVYTCNVSADFINPLLEPSQSTMQFVYMHNNDIPISTQQRPLTFRNISSLPLTFQLRTTPPFSLDKIDFQLEPGETGACTVEFDPGYKDDCQSHVAERKLTVVYVNHPRREAWDLVGDINFPNLQFEYNRVDFGCVLNDTTKSTMVRVTNVSKIDTILSWSFLDDAEGESKEGPGSAGGTRRRASAALPNIAVNQVFDILPIRACLKPNQSETVEFIFYGHANRKFKGTAICDVEGGPEYEIQLAGEASTLGYRLDRQCLDFGQLVFDKSEDREFFIFNTGKVAFNFTVRTDLLTRPGVVVVSPASGRVFANDKQRVIVRFTPGVPDAITEKLVLEIAHFEPVEFPIMGQGIYAMMAVTLPRAPAPGWEDLCAQAMETVQARRAVPPTPAPAPVPAPAGAAADLADSPGPQVSYADGSSPNAGTAPADGESPAAGAAPAAAGAEGPRAPSRPAPSRAGAPSRATVRAGTAGGATTMSMFPGPSPLVLEVEQEASRLRFLQWLKTAPIPVANPDAPIEAGEPVTAAEPAGTARTGPAGSARLGSAQSQTPETAPGFVLAQFVADFGNIIAGTGRKKTFKITNTGPLPISFDLNKQLAAGAGFSIEPTKVVRLPEGESLDFSVVFQTSKNRPLGPVEVVLPVPVKSGPSCELVLKANVTIPDIRITPDIIDFKTVVIGREQVQYLQLHNITPVPTEWECKKGLGGVTQSKDQAFFDMKPAGGLLQPGERVLVQVSFTPTSARPYSLKMPIKIGSNPKPRAITCKGAGAELAISFEPAVADLGPVLPGAPPITAMVNINNNCDYDVEVYSLDFDPQFKIEEDVLRRTEGYDDNGVLRVPVRTPGEGLAKFIMDAEAIRNGQAPPAVEADAEAVEPQGEAMAGPLTPRMEHRALNVLIHGPLLSGKSTVATTLAARWNAPVLTLNSIVEWAQHHNSEFGERVRTTLDPPISAEELAAREAAAKKAAKAKKPLPEPEKPTLPADLLELIIRERVMRADCASAAIIDGLACKYVSDVSVSARAVAAALSRASAGGLRVVLLDFDSASLAARHAAITQHAAKLASGQATLPLHLVDVAADALPADAASSDWNSAAQAQLAQLKAAPPGDAWAAYTAQLTNVLPLLDPVVTPRPVPAEGEAIESKTDAAAAPVPAVDVAAATGADTKEDSDAEEELPRVAHVDAADELDTVMAATTTALPALPEDSVPESGDLPIPDPINSLLVRRPGTRRNRPAIAAFALKRTDGPPTPRAAAAAEPVPEAKGAKGAKAAPAAKGAKGKEPEPEPEPVREAPKMRWVIPARGSVPVRVQFVAPVVGNVDAALGFEVVGCTREFSLYCRGVCAVPTISADPRNVFMHRIKSRPETALVSKKFVMSRNTYEFGPLLVGKNPANRDPATTATNSETFRLTNNGVFPVTMNLRMSGTNPESAGIFSVDPPSVTKLPMGETVEIRVWAFPKEPKLYTETLICTLENNPDAVQFALSCVGAQPKIELHGPWEHGPTPEELAAAAAAEEEARKAAAARAGAKAGPGAKAGAKAAPAAGAKGAKGAKGGAPAIPDGPLIDFDRLLLERREDKDFTINNTCTIPVAWRLDLSEVKGVEEFQISPAEGIISPGGSVTVTVVFAAIREAEFVKVLGVEFIDAESTFTPPAGSPSKVTRLPLIVKAEAYKICPYAKFDPAKDGTPGNGFEYGVVKCGEPAAAGFSLQNQGKYNIKYKFVFKRKVTAALFTVSPEDGFLEPEGVERVTVTFMSPREVRLKDNKDLICQVMEARSGEIVETFPVAISARSVFSKFRIQPMRGINFGAERYGGIRERKLELRNDGEFDFEYRLVAWGSDADNALQAAFRDKRPAPTPISPALVKFGQFDVEPGSGVVKAGGVSSITIKFRADGAAVYRERLRIDIGGRDPMEDLDTFSYQLVGESCIPGINAEDWAGIFEEQAVVRELDPTRGDEANVFALKERVFTFGHIVPMSTPNGICQRFKIQNPNKIPATVDLAIKPASPDSADLFSVQPASTDIPSHEHRYVDVYFKPTTMGVYDATFVATVQGGTDPRTKKLEFGLHGEGTLPCIAIVQPTARQPDGALLLDFGRTQVAKPRTRRFVLRNDGVIPAAVKFDMMHTDAYRFALRGSSVRLAKGETQEIEVTFAPTAASTTAITADISVAVLHNQYDTAVIRCSGTSFAEDVTFENLPESAAGATARPSDDGADHVQFADLRLTSSEPVTSELSFTVRNHRNGPVRFAWNSDPAFRVTPATGHLAPRADKMLSVTFVAPAPAQFQRHLLNMSVQSIKFPEGSTTDGTWDSSSTIVEYKDGGGKTAEPTKTVVPEPKYEPAGDVRQLQLAVSATADTVGFSCDTKSVAFKPTMMFQTRAHKFKVSNPRKTALSLSWQLEDVTSYVGGAHTEAPFVIEPSEATIPAGQDASFTVKFQPQEVEDYEAVARAFVKDMPHGVEPLAVRLMGRAQRPVCHIDLEPSDYLSRRAFGLPGPTGTSAPLEAGIRVLAFKSLGTGVRNTRRFYIINPTNSAYDFTWEPVGAPANVFRCGTPRGTVLAGKRFEVVFEYTPIEVELTEAFYMFSIPEHNLNQMFLVVGEVAEPNVTLDRTHINFHELLVGGSATETVTLINKEHLPFSFSFDTSAFETGSVGRSSLRLVPSSGVVPPGGTLPVEVTFSPAEEKPYNFNAVCVVKKKPTRLQLNVKGEGYAVHERLTLEDDASGTGVEAAVELAADSLNFVEFGHVHVNERAVKNIVISNTGKVNFDFVWSMSKKNPMVTIKPEAGKVHKGSRMVCRLEFYPVTDTVVEGLKLSCLVAGDRQYEVAVSGRGTRPALGMSFMEHNFGPCFIPAVVGGPPQPETVILRITNNDVEADVSFDCTFEKKPHLDVQCTATILAPGQAADVPIVFTPRESRSYTEIIPFEVNGLYTMNVTVTGDGVPLLLELVNPAQATVNFGSLRVGQESARAVKLVNRSRRAVTFSLGQEFEAGHGRLDECAISFSPAVPMTLRPREGATVDLRFSPMARLAAFSEGLMVNLGAGGARRLLTITGACQGMDVKLETDTLTFGSVCEGSRLVKHLQMFNTGDIGTRFQWVESTLAPDFHVHPVAGFLAPHSETKVDITFAPVALNNDIRYEGVRCDIEGAESLLVTLTGECVKQPASDISEVAFEAKVRQEVSKTLTLPKNTTSAPWRLQPVVSNDFWRGPEVIEVAPGATGSYTLTYKPLTMTTVAGRTPHEGSVFLALPDGRALLYRLKGTATAPEVAGTVTKSTPAKQPAVVTLRVDNWLNSTQRFQVSMQMGALDPSVFLKGPEVLDVPAASSRDYKLTYLSYKETVTAGTVTFTNPVTGEYSQYKVQFTATAAEVIAVIPLETPVRQVVKHVLRIDNPLPSLALNFVAPTVPDPNLSVKRLGSGAEAAFELAYRPLVAKDTTTVDLLLKCPELGDYKYKLQLKAVQAAAEAPLYFKTALGGDVVQTFRFRSYVPTACDYECKVGSPYFDVVKSVKAPPATDWDGVEVEVRVKFEPEALGEVKDMLVVRSAIGGEYSCPLVASCTAPRPAGPLAIPNGGTITIQFKNSLSTPAEFVFVVDNPSFSINAGKGGAIPPKKTQPIVVKFVNDAARPKTAKLLVSCPSQPHMPPWIYYLAGTS